MHNLDHRIWRRRDVEALAFQLLSRCTNDALSEHSWSNFEASSSYSVASDL